MTAEEEKELLLRVALRLALHQLNQGGLMPFSATLGPDRNVQVLMPQNMKTHVTQEELDAYWGKELGKAIAAGNIRAICTCADIRVPDNDGNPVPGILLHLEHVRGTAEGLFYPYSRGADAKIRFGQPVREPTTPGFFPSLN